MGKNLLNRQLECVFSAMIVCFPVDGGWLRVLAGLWLDHCVLMLLRLVFLFSSNVASFGSTFLVTVNTVNTYKPAAACSA